MDEQTRQRARAALKTIAYFDIFDYPLTSLEVWKYLYAPGDSRAASGASLDEIIKILKTPELEKNVSFSQGFYFLKNRREIINSRKKRFLIAEPKIKKAKKFCRYLAGLEGVLGVAISNTLALQNARPQSDIDLFIITRAGKIWSTRFWSILPLYIFGGRPRGEDTRDKFCLSFFIDENNLNILPWKMEKDTYYLYWLATLMPLYGRDIFEKFWQENEWVKNYLPNFIPPESSPRLEIKPGVKFPLTRNEKFFQLIEIGALPNQLKEMSQNHGSEVVIGEGVLKFHPNDRRAEYQKEFESRLGRLSLS